jgi:hypothetical protein
VENAESRPGQGGLVTLASSHALEVVRLHVRYAAMEATASR